MVAHRAGEPVAQRALAFLVDAVSVRDPDISSSPGSDGVGWASCELSSSRDVASSMDDLERALLADPVKVWPVFLAVNTRPDMVKDMIRWGLDQGGPDALSRCDAFVEISLSGVIDWAIVRAVCEAAVEMWSAVLRADGSGFDVTLADLP
ncbi:hypothetical protein [Phytohabitans kaempferiae]|uniref:EAL domain-containing protein n=1 Tax=Phytohabitans kaempferiae TaxID=1620943 RepID=A0ABV6MED4_9ACTN